MRRPLAVLLLPILLAGCEQPPTRELAAAQAEVDAARKEGAEQYAADRWREATAALQEARAHIDGKDYRAALSAANLAADRARSAAQAVRRAREAARGETEASQADVRKVLDEIGAIRQEATAAKVADDAFAALIPRVEEVEKALARVGETLTSGDPLQAQRQAAELKVQTADLPTAFRQAQAKWQAENAQRPRGRRGRRR